MILPKAVAVSRDSLVAVILLACSVGCNREPEVPSLKTYTATGTVVDSAGQPVTFGAVEFVSTVDEKLQAIGKIQPDGTFTLMTVVGDGVVPGAIEGKHKATFLPSERGQMPHYFEKPFEIRPGENNFRLVYPYAIAGK